MDQGSAFHGHKLYDSLDAVRQVAGGSLDRSAQPRPFDRLDWFGLVARHTPSAQPLVIRSGDDTGSGWLFLDRKGAKAEALNNWYGLRFGVVFAPADAPRLSLADMVDGLRQAGISQLSIEPLRKDELLADALGAHGWYVHRSRSSVAWRIDTVGMTFDDYWATRPSRLRNTAKRKAKKANLDIVFYDRIEDGLWDDLQSVFCASWKPPEGSPAFLREFFGHEANAGTLRMGLAYKDGQAVAAQLWTVENDIAIIHKLAYRDDAKYLSAGTVLSVEMFRRVLNDDHVAMIDFGNGDDAYKREWMDYSVPLYALTAYDLRHWRGWTALAGKAVGKILGKIGVGKRD